MQKYGQHFLINPSVIQQIVDASWILRQDQLVEIGPGKGALTSALLARGFKGFTTVEIDPVMANYLFETFPAQSGLKIVCQNFLDFDLNSLDGFSTQFVSNLPYIDAAEILDKVLAWQFFKTAVFMFQKEQAQKITAKPGDDLYGPLSVFSQLRAHISLVCNVGKGCFNPPPKVDSRVLAFTHKEFPVVLFKRMQHVVSAAFLHRRKTLLNALCLSGKEKEKIIFALETLHKPLTVRPEQLSPQEYLQLTELI